jgi:hypothetical protein
MSKRHSSRILLDEAYADLHRNGAVLLALRAVQDSKRLPTALAPAFDDRIDFAIRHILDTIASIHRIEDGTDLPF